MMSEYSDFIDVHSFDGSIQTLYTTTDSTNDKNSLFAWILNSVKNNKDTDGIKGLELIVKDRDTSSNVDLKNNLNAEEILCKIILYLKKQSNIEDILCILLEQMRDMYISGRCPQGRTVRLMQVLYSLD